MEPQWIRYEVALLILKRMIAEHGRIHPIDLASLKQMLESPKKLYRESEKKPSFTQLAACYAYATVKLSPRLALILSELFLRLNNSSFAATQLDKYKLILKMGAKKE